MSLLKLLRAFSLMEISFFWWNCSDVSLKISTGVMVRKTETPWTNFTITNTDCGHLFGSLDACNFTTVPSTSRPESQIKIHITWLWSDTFCKYVNLLRRLWHVQICWIHPFFPSFSTSDLCLPSHEENGTFAAMFSWHLHFQLPFCVATDRWSPVEACLCILIRSGGVYHCVVPLKTPCTAEALDSAAFLQRWCVDRCIVCVTQLSIIGPEWSRVQHIQGCIHFTCIYFWLAIIKQVVFILGNARICRTCSRFMQILWQENPHYNCSETSPTLSLSLLSEFPSVPRLPRLSNASFSWKSRV